MVSWRCPHCGAPQPETARCWVCHRSTTSCASCRHFRKAIAGRLGYCALDKRRTPLTGEEERACWERSSTEAPEAANPPLPGAVDPARPGGRGLWGAPIPTEAQPDGDAPGSGMWSEPGLPGDSAAAHNQHEGSVRPRPWGPVPGLREPTGWRRGVRASRKG